MIKLLAVPLFLLLICISPSPVQCMSDEEFKHERIEDDVPDLFAHVDDNAREILKQMGVNLRSGLDAQMVLEGINGGWLNLEEFTDDRDENFPHELQHPIPFDRDNFHQDVQISGGSVIINDTYQRFASMGFSAEIVNHIRSYNLDPEMVLMQLEWGISIDEIVPGIRMKDGNCFLLPRGFISEDSSHSNIIIEEPRMQKLRRSNAVNDFTVYNSNNNSNNDTCFNFDSYLLDEDYLGQENSTRKTIKKCEEYYSQCIAQAIENFGDFKPNDIIDFFKLIEEVNHQFLVIADDEILARFDLRKRINLVIKLLDFENQNTKESLNEIEKNLNLESLLYGNSVSDEEKNKLKNIMSIHAQNALEDFKTIFSDLAVESNQEENISFQFTKTLVESIQLKTQFAQMMSQYGSPETSQAAYKRVTSLSKVHRWVITQVTNTAFYNESMEKILFNDLKKEIRNFDFSQNPDYDILKIILAELIQKWFRLSEKMRIDSGISSTI